MKKWFLAIGSLILVLLIFSGMVTLHGHGQRNYGTCVRLGRNDVIDQNYHDALNYFQGAKKVNPNGSKARGDLDQTQSFVSGQHYFNQRRLRFAAKNYGRAIKIGAISALNHRSLTKYRLVNELRSGDRQFTKFYDQALILNHRHKFAHSNRYLAKIMKNPHVRLRYFRRFRAKVQKLEKDNRSDKRSDQVSGSPELSHREPFRLKAPKVSVGTPSKVTVTKARHEIKRAGINVSEMSNSDVANLIKQAKAHHTGIYQYAKRNY